MLPAYLTAPQISDLIAVALDEDIGPGDVTTEATIPPATSAEAVFLAKQNGVVAGLHVAEQVFKTLDVDLEVRWQQQDGGRVESGEIFGAVSGSAHAILMGERLALNIMQRMSGIASATRLMADAAKPHHARILDTRKTAPGLRAFDKWAVLLGGGENHRIGLFDMILIKDNHIAAAGGIEEAIAAAGRYREAQAPHLQIEVETRTLEEVDAAVTAGGIDRILLDNMVEVRESGIDTSMLQEAVQRIDGRVITEASGNVTQETVPAIAATGVDYISSGALTHSVKALDISLKVTLR